MYDLQELYDLFNEKELLKILYNLYEAPMILLYHIHETHKTITIPLFDGYINKIDWGDDNINKELKHTYDAVKLYEIKIYGDCPTLDYMSNNTYDYLFQVITYGSFQLKKINFARNDKLISIPPYFPKTIQDISNLFYCCFGLKY
jgi:hypothetical protein